MKAELELPLGPLALIISKYYYGVLSKRLEKLDIERYYSVLYYLMDNNGCSQQQICNALAIDKTAMVKVMNYLLRSGYLERAVNPDDRREHFVSLTKMGRQQTRIIVKAFEDIENVIFEGVSKAEKQTFFKVAGSLLINLKELPANDLFFNYKKTGPATSGKRKSENNYSR